MRQPALSVAARLAARALEGGHRLLIVGSAERLETLDKALWTDDPASFLAHGRAGSEWDCEQPILLSESVDPVNGARMLMLVETGLPADFDRFDRVLNLFDHESPGHERARADWRAISGRDGIDRVYWQQNDAGRWEKRG